MIKCSLSLSHGNADDEKSLSINKNTLSKERSSLSVTALNGLRVVDDGVRNEGGLSEQRMKIHENFLKKNSREVKPREGKKRT